MLSLRLRGLRFFIDKRIEAFANSLVETYGESGELAILFPSHAVAVRCAKFFHRHFEAPQNGGRLKIIDLYPKSNPSKPSVSQSTTAHSIVSALVYPASYSGVAKTFWQHTGEGISSRRAELCHRAFKDGWLVTDGSDEAKDIAAERFNAQKPHKGPRRYQRKSSATTTDNNCETFQDPQPSPSNGNHRDRDESLQFVEERYGRNLDMSLAANAKLAIRRRIAGSLTANVDLEEASNVTHSTVNVRKVEDLSEEDVYLYPAGMSSIFNTHRVIMSARGQQTSICFGLGL